HQRKDGRRAQPGTYRVEPAGQYDWDPGPRDDAGRLGTGQIDEWLGQDLHQPIGPEEGLPLSKETGARGKNDRRRGAIAPSGGYDERALGLGKPIGRRAVPRSLRRWRGLSDGPVWPHGTLRAWMRCEPAGEETGSREGGHSGSWRCSRCWHSCPPFPQPRRPAPTTSDGCSCSTRSMTDSLESPFSIRASAPPARRVRTSASSSTMSTLMPCASRTIVTRGNWRNSSGRSTRAGRSTS